MAEESEPPYSTINRRLILVEDDPLVRGALRRSLVTQGYAVLEFGCAEDLLDMLDEQAIEPELLISDVRLPGLDGISLAEQLSVRFPHLRVLLISGYLDDSQLRRVHRCPQFFFQPKPFVGVDLTRLVADILKSVA